MTRRIKKTEYERMLRHARNPEPKFGLRVVNPWDGPHITQRTDESVRWRPLQERRYLSPEEVADWYGDDYEDVS